MSSGRLPLVQRGVAERLICLHDEIKCADDLEPLHRIAVALYDDESDLLKTFIHSSEAESPFSGLVAKLADQPVLKRMAETGGRRVVNELKPAEAGGFTQRLYECGYRSSYTAPIINKDVFYGFLFFNSCQVGFFTPSVVQRLRPYVDLIGMVVMRELDTVRMMQAAVKVIRSVSSARDEETGAHLARMARYARLIAQKLQGKYGLSDEFIEYLFQFCPLHDLGKIAVPDSVLLKPGRLSDAEFEVMKSHVAKGVEIVDLMMRDFGLGSMPHAAMLRNIVAYHHEALNGAGYPYAVKGEDFPIEARIAAVADVFDALTSERPYKKAWSVDEALALLREQAGTKFDEDCVAVLENHRDEIMLIQQQYAETVYD